MNSNIFSLNVRDYVNGIITAVGGAIIATLGDTFTNGTFNVFATDWAFVGKVALSAALGYLLRKFFSTPDGKLGGVV